MFTHFHVELAFESYIAHPYWEETEQLVNHLKKSGVNSVRTEEKRADRLSKYLEKSGLSAAQWEALNRKAKLEWHLDERGRIFIPRHQMSGCLVQTLKTSNSPRPVKDGGQLRSLVQISDFATDRTKADETWVRFVRPTKNGVPLSNQRSERRNEVIKKFTATGALSCDLAQLSGGQGAAAELRRLFEFAGRYVGCGASRNMGHGRFAVTAFEQTTDAAVA